MTRTLLVVLASTLSAAATPLPPAEAERIAVERLYGAWSDPAGTHARRLTGTELRVRLPARKQIRTDDLVLSDAPRLTRAVEGDFTAVVRVSCPPRTKEYLLYSQTFTSAALTAADESGNGCELRCYEKMDADERAFLMFVSRTPRGLAHIGWVAGWDSTGPIHLRLARSGPVVEVATSRDGARWTVFHRHQANWDAAVNVALTAAGNVDVPTEVTFDRYSLTQPKK